MDENIMEVKEISSLDPISYQYFDNLFSHRTIVFNQDVDESIVENVILPLRTFENDDSEEPVSLIINTPGGAALPSLVLINIIDNYKKPLNMYVYGYAMSMGAIILAAGNNNPNVHKYCYKFSFGLIHSGDINLAGNSSACKQTIAFLNDVDETIKQYFLTNTNFTEETWARIEDKEFYMTSTQMKEYGLIDEII